MRPASLVTIVVAVAAVVVAALVAKGGGGASGQSSAARAPRGALRLDMRVSPEKAALLQPLVRQFNASDTQAAGKRVFVDMQAENSGDTEAAIARGREQPDVWSPAGTFWGRLLNLQADKPYVGETNPSIVRTPLVIAMWEPMARVLGWPKKPVSFDDILRLATARDGWAAAGKPQFGRFKYVHTNPDSSTSGAEAVAGSYYAFVGKQEGLTEADVAKAAPKVKQLERSIVHYGDSTLFIEDELCKGGLAYASAAAMEETTVIDFNRRRCASTKLVALYPKEGSFVSDSPYIVLNAPWVSPAKRAAAAAFQRFLAREITPEKAGAAGFRSGDETAKAAGLVSARYGADPSQPRRTLTLPTPAVVNTLLRTWRRDRKPADVELILDNSGSMADDNKLDHAKDGLRAFFKEVAPQDEVGLAKFSDRITPLVPPAPFRRNRAALQRAVRDIIPEDDTSLYDAVLYGVNTVQARADTGHINAVVILTDGEDTHSSATQGQVIEALRRQGEAESAPVRVFTIAYGQDAQQDDLARFAAASGGKGFPADTGDIAAVYRSISSFF
jgi:Ca-activated chloride channel family protein